MVAALFDAVTFSCHVGHVKPEPAIYHHCLNALGLDGGECLFVGDGGSNEFEGARRVGMSPVFVSSVMSELWPERIPMLRAQGDHHVKDIAGLLAIVGLDEAAGLAR
ncbi:MAG: HAD family hydrolase [Vicinamibacterales bacterium]